MSGRGSVSRSFNYARKYSNPEFREKLHEYNKLRFRNRKKKENKRCIDCGILVSPNALRCKSCSIRNNYNKYYKDRENR